MKKGALDSDFQGMYENTDRESDFFWSTWITRIIPENVGRRLGSKKKGDKGGVSVSGRGRKEETNTLRSLGRNPSNVYFYIWVTSIAMWIMARHVSFFDGVCWNFIYIYIYFLWGGPLQRYLQARWISGWNPQRGDPQTCKQPWSRLELETTVISLPYEKRWKDYFGHFEDDSEFRALSFMKVDFVHWDSRLLWFCHNLWCAYEVFE